MIGSLAVAPSARSAAVIAANAGPPSEGQTSIESLSFVGTTTLESQAVGSATTTSNPGSNPSQHILQVNRPIPRSQSGASVPAAAIPAPASSVMASTNPGFSGFAGLTERDQRLAGTGQYKNTQFDVTPPDQGLCVGNGFVLEAINSALQAYTPGGAAASLATPVNEFFRLAPEVTNTNPPVYGPFVFDPRCYYDAATGRWFVTAGEIDVNPATGAFASASHSEIAVSQTGNPTGTWNVFRFSTTDAAHAGCPCFGDQPLIGADKFGFYYSTNEYSLSPFGAVFNGAQVYAMSKAALVAGKLPPVVHIDAGAIPTPGNVCCWYTLQPATSPDTQYDTANGGTEYFLSALDFTGTGDNRIAAWALTNSGSLDSASPDVRLTHVVIGSERYLEPFNSTTGLPVYNADQKPGPTPLADFLNFNFHDNDHLELLNSDDDRMNQVVFAAGKLWAGLNTVVQLLGFPAHIGIAYFVVTPSVSSGRVMATMTKQGYVALDRLNVMYPAIGVNTAGQGVMSFSLSDSDTYPSTGYAPIDAASGAGAVHIAGAGAKPQDDFSGYHYFGGNEVARWGDYSAAVAAADGSIWVAAEYIPDLPRLFLADWGTFIGHVTP
jgi:hypothetical protein